MAAPAPAGGKAGWLTKKAVRSREKNSWKRRWVVIDASAGTLAYFHTDTKKEAILVLKFDHNTAVRLTTEHKKPHEFVIEFGVNKFFAVAGSAEEASAWVECATGVAEQIKKKKRASTGSSYAARIAKACSVGANDVGQLGLGNQNSAGIAKPDQITVLKAKSQPVYVAAGHRHGAAVTGSDQLFVWGEGSAGQLGMGPEMHRSTRPHLLTALRTKRVLMVACGGSHTLAIVADAAAASGAMTLGPLPHGSAVHNGSAGGALMVWGSSSVGALGLGDETSVSTTPALVSLPEARVTHIFAGMVTSAAVTEGKNLYVWGDASNGRLGLGDIGAEKGRAPVWSPVALTLSDPSSGATLLPSHVALGGLASAFLGRPANAPPGSPSWLFIAGTLGPDASISELVTDPSSGAQHPAVGGVISVSPMECAADSLRTMLKPTVPPELEKADSCIYAAAGPTHIAVVIRELQAAAKPAGGLGGMLAAAKAAKAAEAGAAAGGAAPAPAPPVWHNRVYTAGFGFLGHDQPAGKKAIRDAFACTSFRAVNGLLADEEILDASCGLYSTFVRNQWGELLSWGINEFGGLNTGKYIDLPVPAPCQELPDAHYEQYACGTDFFIGLQYPGLVGDARARALAKNAFAKWRRKVTGGADANLNSPEMLNSLMEEVAADIGMDEEIKALGLDFNQLMQSLLRVGKADEVESQAEAAAAAGARPRSTRVSMGVSAQVAAELAALTAEETAEEEESGETPAATAPPGEDPPAE